MRGKKAKQLRRIAAQQMMGKPERELFAHKTHANRQTAVNGIDTVRGRYRFLKRAYKAAMKMVRN